MSTPATGRDYPRGDERRTPPKRGFLGSSTPNWGLGFALGIAIGVSIGVSMGNIAIGIAIGSGLSVAFALAFGEATKPRGSEGETSDPDDAPDPDDDAEPGAAPDDRV